MQINIYTHRYCMFVWGDIEGTCNVARSEATAGANKRVRLS